MPDGDYKRIHPLTMVIELGRFLRQFALALVVFAFTFLRGGSGDTFELFATGIGAFAVVGALVRYLTYGYRVQSGVLSIKQGVITKKNRTIPLDRIQNINISRSVLHRLLGLADLQIETAGGAEPEARLSALTEADARVLRADLLAQSGLEKPPAAEGEAPAESRVVYQATPREIFYAGATENRALAIIAALMGLTAFGGQEELADGLLDQIPMVERTDWRFWAIAVLGFLFIGWLVSIGSAFLQYWNFTLRFSGSDLRRKYGLANQVENIVPLRRIQIVRIAQSPLQRLFSFAKMHVETAGSMISQATQSGQQQQASSGSVIAPLLGTDRVPGMLQMVLLSARWPESGWRKISPKSIARRLRAALFGGIIPALVIGGAGHLSDRYPWWWGAVAYAGFLALSYVGAVLRYRTTRWHRQEETMVAQEGVLGRSAKVAPVGKIQSLTVRQSPIQRRLGLISMSFRAAAFSQSAEVTVEDLEEGEGMDLAQGLHDQNRALAWRNPDGF